MTKKVKEIDPIWMDRYGHEPTFEEIWMHYGYKPPVIPKKLPAPQFIPETACFAFNEKAKNGCECLTQCWCQWGKCNFFKTREQYDEETERDKPTKRRNHDTRT